MTRQQNGAGAANTDAVAVAVAETIATQAASSSPTSVPRPRDTREDNRPRIVIPVITDETSTLAAALEYADTGMHLFPVDPKTRVPRLKEWQKHSSRDPEQLYEWFIGTDSALAWHVGRSGCVVFDVDRPERMPTALAEAIEAHRPPFQATRNDDDGRGHYVFTTDRILGNSRGQLYDVGTDPALKSRGWGEVRGRNGFILLTPSPHAKQGHYHWKRTGLVPELTEHLSQRLPDGSETADAATDATVARFMATHTAATQSSRYLGVVVEHFRREAQVGSRHEALVNALCWAMREARMGYYPAARAVEELRPLFLAAIAANPTPGRNSVDEFNSAVAYAVGQAEAEDLAALHGRSKGPAPEAPAVEDEPPLPLEERDLPQEPPAWFWEEAPASDVPEAGAGDAQPDEGLAYELLVRDRMRFQAAQEEAAQRLQARRAGALTIPAPIRGDAFLAVPDEPVQYRIDGLQPVDGRVVFTAQFKAGKSTGMGNLTRCLVDGTPFLDTFDVVPPEGGVVVIDNELAPAMLRRWTREQNIHNIDRVHIVSLRGRVSTFDILSPPVRAQWAAAIRATGATYVIFDCLRPVLDALGLSEDKDAGRFLVAFDALLAEAGIAEAVVVHHAGHSGDRSRGDSRIRDWPDVEWRLVRQKGADGISDPAAPRFFSAFGRDVDVAEGLLTFDPAHRRLAYSTTNRAAAAGEAALPAVLELLEKHPRGLSGREAENEASTLGVSRDAVRKALIAGRQAGTITTVQGPRRATLHVRSIPTVSRSLA